MKKLSKEFKHRLFLAILLAGFIYGFVIYFALHERAQNKVYGKEQFSEKEVVIDSDSLQSNRSYIIVKRKCSDTIKVESGSVFKDEDQDQYDNPDFDDLIPGDEYDEEFVDRSNGDPELYK